MAGAGGPRTCCSTPTKKTSAGRGALALTAERKRRAHVTKSRLRLEPRRTTRIARAFEAAPDLQQQAVAEVRRNEMDSDRQFHYEARRHREARVACDRRG